MANVPNLAIIAHDWPALNIKLSYIAQRLQNLTSQGQLPLGSVIVVGYALLVYDNKFTIADDADHSKRMRFEVASLSSGTVRVLTMPDADTTVPIATEVITFAGPTAARTVTLPDADTTVPIATEELTLSGPTAARTITLPDADTTVPLATEELTFSGPTAARTITLPDADTTVPLATEQLTFSGPTAARTVTLPDANFTAARTDAGQTFTGAETFSGKVTQSAGQQWALEAAGSSPFTITGTAVFVGVTNAAATTVKMPAASAVGDWYVVTDPLGQAGSNNITVDGNGKNINGASTYVISTNYDSVRVLYTGSEWITW